MMRVVLAGAFWMAVYPDLCIAAAESGNTWDLARVVKVSAAISPAVRLAESRIPEAEAKRIGADTLAAENPRLAAVFDRRSGTGGSLDVEATLEVPLAYDGGRRKRLAVAEADIEGERWRLEEARRQAVTAAARAFFAVLHAEARAELAHRQRRLAEGMLETAQARYDAGQVPRIDVNLARAELARADARIAVEMLGAARARAGLASRLGLPSSLGLRVTGDLKDRRWLEATVERANRPDVLALLAEVRSGEAQVILAESERRPNVALTAGYAREGAESVLLAGVSVSLPLFNPRKGGVLEAQARLQRARIEADALAAAAAAEAEGAREAYRAAVEAVRQLEGEALPRVVENEDLAQESYREGKAGLTTLLQLRRETLAAHLEYLDSLFAAADAGIDLASTRGVLSTSPIETP